MRRLGDRGAAVGRVLLIVIGLLVVVGALLVLGLRTYMRSSLPSDSGVVTLPGISEPVTVYWDSLGVPFVHASSLDGASFVLGYLHARDRLWQMDLTRRAALGQLAELFGERALQADRLTRRLGLGRAARVRLEALPARSRRWLESYANGVNAYMTARSGAWPPEFLALRYEPEPWRPVHSMAVGVSMGWQLTEWDYDVELANAAAGLTDTLVADLLPRYPDWAPAAVPTPAGRRTSAYTAERAITHPAAVRSVARLRIPYVPKPLDDVLGPLALSASNAWAVAPSRSLSGEAILANDMHLPPRQPPPWYLAGIEAGRYSATGMTLPGLPFVIAGHSRAVAWGLTAALTDNLDFYLEQIDPADSTRYLTPDGWERMRSVAETIHVRGRDEPVVEQVPITRHGPVIELDSGASGAIRTAVAWTGAMPGDELQAIVDAGSARNAAELAEAFRSLRSFQLNIVYADSAGTIGYQLAGCVPRRDPGSHVLPVRGWLGDQDWGACLPYDSLPRVVNPEEGIVVSANNLPTRHGPYLGAHFAPGYRAQRIRERLLQEGPHDVASFVDIQRDIRSTFAQRYREAAVRAARESGFREEADRLSAWNLEAGGDERAAALFYVWFESFVEESVTDQYGSLPRLGRESLARWLDRGESPWFDDTTTPETESPDEIGARAFVSAVDRLGARTWGDLLVDRHVHPLSASRWLESFLRLNVGPFPGRGGPYTVRAAYYSGMPLPPRVMFAPSQRHVADFGALDERGGFLLPTGQSGNPFSPHYRDQATGFRHGSLHLLPLSADRVRAAAVDSLRVVAIRD